MSHEDLKKRFQKARLPGADFRKQFGKQWTQRNNSFFTMRFSLRFVLAALTLLALPFAYSKFPEDLSQNELANQFLAQAEEAYGEVFDGILYEKTQVLSLYRGEEYDHINETWIAPNGSMYWESRSVDGQENEMSGVSLSLVDERGVTFHYIEDYVGYPPAENPYCVFITEDESSYSRIEMEMDGSSQPGFGGIFIDKTYEEDLNAVDAFLMAFESSQSSREQAKRIVEELKDNSEWEFVEKEDDEGHFYVFSTSSFDMNIEVVFNVSSAMISEITTSSGDTDRTTIRYLEQKLLPVENYEQIFTSDKANLSLADITPVPLPEDIAEGCYSIIGEKLSQEESDALLSTLKEGYIEESIEMHNEPF